MTVIAEQAAVANNVAKDIDDDFAPIKLTKDQEENMRGTKKEAITLEGQFDLEAFTEKFESKKDSKKQDKGEEKTEVQETKESKELKEHEEKVRQEAEAAKKAEENKQMLDSVNQIREILGMNTENDRAQEK